MNSLCSLKYNDQSSQELPIKGWYSALLQPIIMKSMKGVTLILNSSHQTFQSMKQSKLLWMVYQYVYMEVSMHTWSCWCCSTVIWSCRFWVIEMKWYPPWNIQQITATFISSDSTNPVLNHQLCLWLEFFPSPISLWWCADWWAVLEHEIWTANEIKPCLDNDFT